MSKVRHVLSTDTTRLFLVISLIIILAVSAMAGLMLSIYAKGKDEAFLRQNITTLDFAKSLTSQNFEAVATDLDLLSLSLPLQKFLTDNDLTTRSNLEKSIRNFSLSRSFYNHITFIDESGFEVVRIDNHDGYVEIVPDNLLENVSSRPYFLEAQKTPTGDVYVSPIVVHTQHDKLEIPQTFGMYMSLPVYDSAKRNRGMLVFDVLSEPLIHEMTDVLAAANGQVMLLDEQGDWLQGLSPENANNLKVEHGSSFASSYPEAWPEISKMEAGLIDTPEARFVFTSIQPYQEARKRLIKRQIDDLKINYRQPNSQRWIMVSKINAGLLTSIRNTILWQAFAAYLLVLGALIGAAALVIRARKKSQIVEKELGQKSILLQLTLESIDQGFAVWNADGKLKIWNDKCQDYWYSPDFIHEGTSQLDIMRHVAKKGGFGEGETELLADKYCASYMKKTDGVSEKFKMLDGRVIDLKRYTMPNGGHAAVYTDITHQQIYENILSEARDAAEAGTRSKSDFLAAMSHEIRTPMNGVVGMIELMQQTEMSPDQQVMMNTAHNSALLLLQIINDILDISKIEAGKVTLEAIPVSICEVMENVCSALAPISNEKCILLNLFVDPDIPLYVVSDPVRLYQIMINLLSNAIKFTDNVDGKTGEVTLRADLIPGVGYTKEGDCRAWVRFSINDTGIGMSPDALTRLFQPFSQADQSMTRRFGGTGIGLFICKSLTALMGGQIEAVSSEGVGSDFIVTLPFENDGQADASEEIDFSNLSVGYITPSDTVAEVVTHYLTARGVEVSRLSRSEDLLVNIRSNKPMDVLVIDNGWSSSETDVLIATLRNAEDLKALGLLLMTERLSDIKEVIKEGLIRVAKHPLLPSAFYQGVALAAGLLRPEDIVRTTHFIAPDRKAPSVEAARETGELILLAEDNVTNQDVIRRQLNVLGYACETASNGAEALEKVKRYGYALLLTDLHMPEINGYDLSIAIRDMETNKPGHLPIIAISASALQGDAKRCFDAGMDDYLSKPIEMKNLKLSLDKWMPRVEAETPTNKEIILSGIHKQSTPGKTDIPLGEGVVIETTYLKETFGDKPDLIREILMEFIDPATSIVKEITAAFLNHDAEGVSASAHKLKSSSRAIGATLLADLCVELEKAGKLGQWDLLNELHQHLQPTFDPVRSHIEGL